MSERPHDSQAPASAFEDLDKRLQAAADDAMRLREIVDRSSVSIAATLEVRPVRRLSVNSVPQIWSRQIWSRYFDIFVYCLCLGT